jgi:hypothetical protein
VFTAGDEMPALAVDGGSVVLQAWSTIVGSAASTIAGNRAVHWLVIVPFLSPCLAGAPPERWRNTGGSVLQPSLRASRT